MTTAVEEQTSLSIGAAHLLSTTTKTRPQMEETTPRWLLQLLPWVQVEGGVYRVNRRRRLRRTPGRVTTSNEQAAQQLSGEDLRAVSLFEFADPDFLDKLARIFVPETAPADHEVVVENDSAEKLYIIIHGKVEIAARGSHGSLQRLGLLTDGEHFGELSLLGPVDHCPSIRTLTPADFLTLDRAALESLLSRDEGLRQAWNRAVAQREAALRRSNAHGEAVIDVISGHEGQPVLPIGFPDYDPNPLELHLSVVQTVVMVHTRVSDVYNSPYDQLDEQVRLTVESIKEREEWEIINNPSFGLLNVPGPEMRIPTRTGPPTPDDLDELLALMWKKPAFFLASPRAIAAFGRECTRRGVPPPTVMLGGYPFVTWRGVPLVPTDKLEARFSQRGRLVSDILVMRVGEAAQGVVGLHHAGLKNERVPSVNVIWNGVDAQGVGRYLVTAYYGVAALTSDAVGVLEDVELGNYYDYN